MIPISDENPTLRTPVVTYLLLATMLATWVLFEGAGKGTMVVRAAFTWEDVEKREKVQVGDVAVLADRDWPLELQGQRLGVVTRVEPMRDAHKFAEVHVEPVANLMMLKEVMVLAK